MKITIETTDKAIKNHIERTFNHAMNATNFEGFYNLLRTNIYSTLKIGKGGSHIWIADKTTGNRVAIILDTCKMMK